MMKQKTQFLFLSIFLFLANFSYGQCTVQGIKIQAFLADPNQTGGNNFDTDGDGTASTEDEFVQICNTSSSTVSIAGFTLQDNSTVTGYTFGSGESLAAGECVTVIREWNNSLSAIPSYMREMGLGGGYWNNGGDDINLSDGLTTCTVAYPSTAYPEQDGCATVVGSTTGTVDCSLTPSDLTSSPLPVELISFSATEINNNVAVSWSTASELNNDYFDVQKSDDGTYFYSIGSVDGYGNSHSTIDYNFIDYHYQPNSFYRLKQVDYNGDYEYSNVISLMEEIATDMVSQTSNELIINPLETANVLVTNQKGQVLLNKAITNELSIDKQAYVNGIYFVQVTSSQGSQTVKWINLN
jgi:hypothetical protein